MPVTGDGDFPFRSTWLGRGRGRGKTHLLNKTFAIEDGAGAQPLIWRDWLFETAAGGGATVIAVTAVVLTLLEQPVKANSSRIVASISLALQGQPIVLNVRRSVAIAATAVTQAAQALAVNARALIATGQASIALLGQSITIVNLASSARQLWTKIRISP